MTLLIFTKDCTDFIAVHSAKIIAVLVSIARKCVESKNPLTGKWVMKCDLCAA